MRAGTLRIATCCQLVTGKFPKTQNREIIRQNRDLAMRPFYSAYASDIDSIIGGNDNDRQRRRQIAMTSTKPIDPVWRHVDIYDVACNQRCNDFSGLRRHGHTGVPMPISGIKIGETRYFAEIRDRIRC